MLPVVRIIKLVLRIPSCYRSDACTFFAFSTRLIC